MSGFSRKKENPITAIKYFWPDADISHITYDENLADYDYQVIRQMDYDGTLLLFQEFVAEALINIVQGNAYCTGTEPEWSTVDHIEYIIGPVREVSVYGSFFFKCSKTRKFPGKRVRIRMPVKCKYILKEKAA